MWFFGGSWLLSIVWHPYFTDIGKILYGHIAIWQPADFEWACLSMNKILNYNYNNKCNKTTAYHSKLKLTFAVISNVSEKQ